MPGFALPDHTEVSTERLDTVTKRHAAAAAIIWKLPETGIFKAGYALGPSDPASETSGQSDASIVASTCGGRHA